MCVLLGLAKLKLNESVDSSGGGGGGSGGEQQPLLGQGSVGHVVGVPHPLASGGSGGSGSGAIWGAQGIVPMTSEAWGASTTTPWVGSGGDYSGSTSTYGGILYNPAAPPPSANYAAPAVVVAVPVSGTAAAAAGASAASVGARSAALGATSLPQGCVRSQRSVSSSESSQRSSSNQSSLVNSRAKQHHQRMGAAMPPVAFNPANLRLAGSGSGSESASERGGATSRGTDSVIFQPTANINPINRLPGFARPVEPPVVADITH